MKKAKEASSIDVRKAEVSNGNIDSLYAVIHNVLIEAKNSACKAVNSSMVTACWEVGKLIVEEEQKGKSRAGYGEYLIRNLSERLTKNFGMGFNEANLRYMRQFYTTFPIRHAVRDELSWTHYRLLIRVKNVRAREYYLNETIEQNWSTRALERQIDTSYYERILASQNNPEVRKEAAVKTGALKKTPEDFIKDPYVLEFLGMNPDMKYLEKELEQGLIDKLQKFLLELGKGFSFVSRQKRITLDGDHFYIDLVFYNYVLKRFVLFDLKIGTLAHQDIGQMQMYVNYYDRKLLNEGDNKTIGVILCASKKDSVVKYTLPEDNKNIFASKYQLYLPTEAELKREIEYEKNLLEQEKKLSSDTP